MAFLRWPNVGHVYPPFLGIAVKAGVTWQFCPLLGATKRVYVATLPICGPLLIFPPSSEAIRTP